MAEQPADLVARMAALRESLERCMLRDRAQLAGAVERVARRPGAVDPREVDRLTSRLAASVARAEARRVSIPAIAYDDRLPVHLRREEIAAAIAASPVTIVSGATGSGKSTQLPKICLELGRGVRGLIGHTQPRRIAAQALAGRIATELGTESGGLVGYQVRFVDRTGPGTLVKLMTDGVLLRELASDPALLRYDTIILDEAHERSLNVDFLLGVCRQLVRRRPELRVIVTSATIETKRFAEYFGGAPVIDVEGRSYPVEVRYRPLQEDDEDKPSLPEAVRGALEELTRDSRGIEGDALVFLPGEKQIHETRDLLARSRLPWEVLPLYARLSAAEQERIFAPHTARRAVLATNVAETSLTIPGVRFVVDAGLARVSRYSPRAKFQRLPIEPVSQASADQRKGRCGREGEGICIRLYGEDDFAARATYTDPEILRTNLASLILQMAALGLGAPEEFPFLDAPDDRLLNDGYRLLQELGAVDGDRRITRLGRQLAVLPVDPRLARVLVEAGRRGCLADALVLAAFLSIQDPRVRPLEQAEAADEKHALFADPRSDFVAVLNLWRASREQAAAGTKIFRHWCKLHFLSFPRMREWVDLHEQLTETAASLELGRVESSTAGSAVLHQCILTGFLGGIGVLDEGKTYLGARDTRFVIAPGTPLQRRPPHWVVAASLVETQRLYARTVAQVQPSWIEAAGAHLVRRTYGDAEWDAARGAARVTETVTLYGRVLSSGRKVDFAPLDPGSARRMFVEEALVRGSGMPPFAFLERNAATRARLEHVECCLRRRDLLASDEALVEFFLARLPETIMSVRRFAQWWRAEEPRRPHLLDAPEDVFLSVPLPTLRRDDFPDSLHVDGNELALHYAFDATDAADGVTLDVPLPLLRALPSERLDWLVPGWLRDKVIALLRGLPKDLRRELVPIPDSADAFLAEVQGSDGFAVGSLFERLAAFVTRRAGQRVEAEVLADLELAPWLRINLRVLGEDGRPLRQGRDLLAVREQLRERAARRESGPAHAWSREGVRRWDFGDIPESVQVPSGKLTLRMYPGLEDRATEVRLKLYSSAEAARKCTRQGLVRLAALALPQQRELVRREVAGDRHLALRLAAAGYGRELLDEIADRAVASAVLGSEGVEPRTREAFERAVELGRSRVVEQGAVVMRVVTAVLECLDEVRAQLAAMTAPVFAEVCLAARSQLDDVLGPGWVRETPEPWFEELPRYLRALVRRLERARHDVSRDRRLQQQIEPYLAAAMQLVVVADTERETPELDRLRWMIEEFRVSLFAQELRTRLPVSAQRLAGQLALARKEVSRASPGRGKA